jgi:hypothetical protein
MIEMWIFLYSFLTYSVMRYVDVHSTKLCLAKLDPQMHEVNPVITRFLKRMSFNKTMILTWILFAIPTAVLDTYFILSIAGFPLLCWIFGIFHLMAAANNYQLHFQIKLFGADTIKENTLRTIKMLEELPLRDKLTYLTKTNFFNIFLAAYSLVALVLLNYWINSVEIAFRFPIPVLLAFGPVIMIADLILFFPATVFGSLIISFRRLKIARENEEKPAEETELTVPVTILEEAIHQAKKEGFDSISIHVQSKFNQSTSELTSEHKGGENTGS